MSGIMMAVAAATIGGGSNTLSVTTGSYTSGGKASFNYSGYNSDASIVVSSFGSVSPTTNATGAAILAIYWTDAGSVVYAYLRGNLVGAYSSIKIGATTYSFTNTGTYDSGNNRTSWVTSGTIGTTPFSGTITVVLQ